MDYRSLNYNNMILLESLYIYVYSLLYKSDRSRTYYPAPCCPDGIIELVTSVPALSVF
jgi:hypothetical protein